MATSAKKKSSKAHAKPKSSVKKKSQPKAARPAKKKTVAKAVAKTTKKTAVKKGTTPKANGARKEFGPANASNNILATKNHKPKKLDPFVRGQKEKLLQLR